jgi:hypothetical protein
MTMTSLLSSYITVFTRNIYIYTHVKEERTERSRERERTLET